MDAPGLWIVAVGASGSQGMHDLRELLAALPVPFPAVLLAVVHRPADRVSYLREFLAAGSEIPVGVASEGERLRAGVCYIGEPAAHLTLGPDGAAHLVADPGATYRNRTIDLLFGSLAKVAVSRLIGVVLSGALDDGSRGLAAISVAGGQVMVLTPYDGGSEMPANAIRFDGPPDFVGAVPELAREIARVVSRPADRDAARASEGEAGRPRSA